MQTAMLLLTVTLLSAGTPAPTSSDRPARQSSAQGARRDRALRDGIARSRRNEHRRLGDFNLPAPDRAYA